MKRYVQVLIRHIYTSANYWQRFDFKAGIILELMPYPEILNIYMFAITISLYLFLNHLPLLHQDLKPSNVAVNEDCELRVRDSVHTLCAPGNN